MNTRYAPHTTNKTAFIWFLLLFFLLNFGQGVLPPLLPPVMGGLGLGFASAGLLGTAFGLTRFLVDFPAGVLAEKFGVGRIVHIGAALLLTGSALSALADSLPVMLIARGIAGVGSGLTVVFSSIYIIRMGAPDGRVRRGNLYEVAAIGGTAVSTILAGEIALRCGWRWGFALAAFVVFLGWFVAAFWVLPGLGEVIWSEGGEDSRRSGEPPKISGWTIFILLFMTFSVSVCWSGGITTFLPLYGGKGLGFSSATVGGAMTIALVVTALFLFPVGWASDRFGRFRVLIPGFLLLVGATLLLPWTRSVRAYTIVGTLIALGVTIWWIPPSILAKQFPGGFRGKTAGIYRGVSDSAYVLAPFTVGWLIDKGGFAWTGAALAGVYSLSIILCLVFFWRSRKNSDGET